MKLCCGLMDGQFWDATLQPASERGAEGNVVVVLSNEEVLSPEDADFGEFTIAEATEEERRIMKQAGYTMTDWDPTQWLGCAGCHAGRADGDTPREGPDGTTS